MGNKYTVEIWDGYSRYLPYHRGESLITALWYLWKAKRTGHGCAVLYWRG